MWTFRIPDAGHNVQREIASDIERKIQQVVPQAAVLDVPGGLNGEC
jgi:hypothetical protein